MDVEEEAPSSTRPHVPSSIPTSAATVLVVEDNADMRGYLREHLAPIYQVVEAADGKEGLQRARETRPDLIVSDVMMPRMDGLALLKALKQEKELATIPVILLTARAAEADRLEGLEAQADDYIAKPFSPAELKARVRNLIVIRQALRTRYAREVVAVQPDELDLEEATAAFLEKARAVTQAHLDASDFNVQVLADALFVSKRKLERRLKALTGQTPAAFIRQMRLQRARQLLEQHAVETVSEVAHAVGFNKVSYFTRVYRQTFGQAPADVLASAGP